MTEELNEKCSIRNCQAVAVANGAQTALPMCASHLRKDRKRVLEIQASLENKLEPVRTARDRLRLHQQLLMTELHGTENLLNAIIDAMTKYKETVMSRLNARNDAAKQKLAEFDVLQEYDHSMAAAQQADDVKKIFELASQMDLGRADLENAIEGVESFEQSQSKHNDVRASLRDLHGSVVKKINNATQSKECTNNPSESTNKVPITTEEKSNCCKLLNRIKISGDKPVWISSCSNTNGFVYDSSDFLVRSDAGDRSGLKLPEPCLIVSCESRKDLLVLSLDGSVRLRCESDIDWSNFITGLHCDSDRQQLYVLQRRSAVVMSLNGRILRQIKSPEPMVHFSGIDGNQDSLFMFDQTGKKLYGILRKAGSELQLHHSVADFYDCKRTFIEALVMHGGYIYITQFDKGCIHKVCANTGELRASLLAGGEKRIEYPSDLAASRQGRIIVCDYVCNILHVLNDSGEILQTIGNKNSEAKDFRLERPHGVTVLLGEEQELLVVTEREGESISIFKLN